MRIITEWHVLQLGVLLLLAAPADISAATLKAETIQAWDAYVAATESRIEDELAAPRGFLVTDFAADAATTRGALIDGAIPIGKLKTIDGEGKTIAVPDGLIAHWRGAVFLPGVTLDALLNRLQHPNERGPHQQDVVALRVLEQQPDQLRLAIRMTRRKIVTVTYDTEHVVRYRRHGPTRVSSTSVSSKIVEVDDAGTPAERALPEGNDRGFLWRMNSYWRYEQVDDGVIVELESITLSRSIPFGLGTIVEPIVDRIARESINRTLDTMRQQHGGGQVMRRARGSF
jgi:hypothetical protein